MKRILSILLTAVMLVNLACAVPAAGAAETFTLSRVYADNSLANWDAVYIYGWGYGISGEVAMTQIEGTDIWYYDLPQPISAGTSCFLFKNTASNWDKQSADVTVTEPYNCYVLSATSKAAGTWTTYTESADEGYTVYYVDSARFEQPYAYAWNEGGESCGTFPGIAMTLTTLESPDGSPVYSCTFDTQYEYIIFGDGAESQTSDLVFTPGQYLWWNNDTWYESLADIPDDTDPALPCTVYFQNNWLWTEVSLYYWYADESFDYAWPGEAMELHGNDGTYDIYKYTVPADAAGFVISGIKNDGSGALDQTPNIEYWYDGSCYSMIWSDGNDVTENDISVVLPDLGRADLMGHSISLTGMINVRFHFDLSPDLAEDENTKVVFTVPSTGSTYTVDAPIGYADVDDNGYYVFTCQVAAKEMTSTIKAQLVSTDFEGEALEYTVQAYADYILSHPEDYPNEQALVKAMLNYGTASQLHFDYNTDNLANDCDSMSETDRQVAAADLSAYAPVIQGEAGNVKFYGASLILKSETSMKLYFRVDGAIENPAVNINGFTAGLTKNGGVYEIKFQDIAARDLGVSYTVGTDGLTITYSPLSYAYQAQSSQDPTLVNVANALAAYYQAVCEYWNEA